MKLDRITLSIAAVLAGVSGLALSAPQEAGQPARAAAQGPMVQADANRDGFIDRAEAAGHPRLLQRLDQLDTDKDGRISAAEMRAGHMGMGGRHGKQGGMMGQGRGMPSLDADGDGRISPAEAGARPPFAARFDQLDVNKDGYIDAADRQARMAAQRDAWFKAADRNGDGQISRAEFEAHHASRMAERQQRREARQAAPKPR